MEKLKFSLKEGMGVIAVSRFTTYAESLKYQIVIEGSKATGEYFDETSRKSQEEVCR
ncbi:exonuclease VII large subunit [Bartonella callosciuri]|uniref:Exonuclease VII large subunit n=1 Tax=Bartonella callosciuri TaxID=686223 RepID=A0A840NQB0_9HYPH|nr:hypothetical protein [Bartonella callosciuri]MBB5073271.1 exonuclease VII large subunit [Bartonella callosciuri]